MTFYEPTRKLPVTAFVVFFIVAGLGSVIFFSLKECRSSGIFRSGKSSDATELYQVFPIVNGEQKYLLSLEGVYKTRIYERKGGITTRSGSTDVRITMHDLKTGEQVNRLVLGDYHDAYSKILGVGNQLLWMYNANEGLHSRSVNDLEINTSEEMIIPKNSDLSEGFAKADQYLSNLDELFAFNQQVNALMITTLSGKTIWIDASTFKTVEAPQAETKKTDLDEMIEEITQQALHGVPVDMEAFSSKIIEMASDLSAFSDIDHASNNVMGFDSCSYNFEGETVKTIVKSNCPQPQKVSGNENNKGLSFIEPVFLSSYNTTMKQYTNPEFLENTFCVLHSKSIGKNPDLLLSLIDKQTKQTQWTISTGIKLSNEGSRFQISGVFGGHDTVFVSIENFLFAFNQKTGKLFWKSTIGTGEYQEQLYYIGDAYQNGKRFFLTASSYFTELSREGIFVHGRTDYKLNVLDAATGKLLKKTEITNSKPQKLPYYLGMSNNKAWFYSSESGFHTRSLPDLTITSTSFDELLTKAGITTGIVETSGYDDALESKYIAFDEKNNAVYFTTQNGLYYQYSLSNAAFTEIKAPSDEQYENYMYENNHVKFYRTRISYMFHHEIFFADGNSVELNKSNAITGLTFKNNEPEKNNGTKQPLQSNQFIEGQFLVNGVNISGTAAYTENNRTPLTTDQERNALYIFHKDKISPDAHLIISKYDVNKETVLWKFDITDLLLTHGEISRIYTNQHQLIFIFKTHPELDDSFTCVSIDANTGKLVWQFKF